MSRQLIYVETFKCYYSTQLNEKRVNSFCRCTVELGWRLFCKGVKVRLADCSREGGCSVLDVVQTAGAPQTIKILSRPLQTAHSVLASSIKHCPVSSSSTTHSERQIQYDSSSWDTITGTAWIFTDWDLDRVPSDFIFHVPVVDHVVRDAADEHVVLSPRTMACLSCPQLWVSLCWWLLLNSQRCCPSQSDLSRATPERVEPGGKHSIWLTFAQKAWATCSIGLCAYLEKIRK